MTVGQLIEALEKFDKDLHIVLMVEAMPTGGSLSSADNIDPENIFVNTDENIVIRAVE